MRLALGLVVVLTASAAAAPKSKGKKQPPSTRPAMSMDYVEPLEATSMPSTSHKEGDYGGVEPGEKPSTDKPTKHRAPPRNTLNWIGFEAKEGGASVFFQATAPFEVAQHVEGNQLVAMIALPRMGPNAWRQVDTRFFDNPLSGVIARQVSARGATKTSAAHGAGIEVRFSFKNAGDAKEATLRTATEADGQYYVYLAFPQSSASSSTPSSAKPDLR